MKPLWPWLVCLSPFLSPRIIIGLCVTQLEIAMMKRPITKNDRKRPTPLSIWWLILWMRGPLAVWWPCPGNHGARVRQSFIIPQIISCTSSALRSRIYHLACGQTFDSICAICRKYRGTINTPCYLWNGSVWHGARRRSTARVKWHTGTRDFQSYPSTLITCYSRNGGRWLRFETVSQHNTKPKVPQAGPALGGAGPNWEQFLSAQDPSQLAARSVELGAGPNWEQLVQLA